MTALNNCSFLENNENVSKMDLKKVSCSRNGRKAMNFARNPG